jgi:hypothetical protein
MLTAFGQPHSRPRWISTYFFELGPPVSFGLGLTPLIRSHFGRTTQAQLYTTPSTIATKILRRRAATPGITACLLRSFTTDTTETH